MEDRRNRSKLYNPMTVQTLQLRCPDLDWVEYLNTLTNQCNRIDESEIVILVNVTFPGKLCYLLGSTPKR